MQLHASTHNTHDLNAILPLDVRQPQVNSSVDVFAFGILMWEMYTGQRPYGNMKQQQLVEEVVMRGLRPKFPSHAPPAYVALAQACWSGSAQARPTFDESLTTLNGMLQQVDEKELGSFASGSFSSMSEAVEYMQNNVHRVEAVQGAGGSTGGTAPAGAAAPTAGGSSSGPSAANGGSVGATRVHGPVGTSRPGSMNAGSPLRGTLQNPTAPAQPSGLSNVTNPTTSPRPAAPPVPASPPPAPTQL